MRKKNKETRARQYCDHFCNGIKWWRKKCWVFSAFRIVNMNMSRAPRQRSREAGRITSIYAACDVAYSNAAFPGEFSMAIDRGIRNG